MYSQRGWHSTEVPFLLLTSGPVVRFSAFWKLFYVTETYWRRWLEESGQSLDNVHRTHLVLLLCLIATATSESLDCWMTVPTVLPNDSSTVSSTVSSTESRTVSSTVSSTESGTVSSTVSSTERSTVSGTESRTVSSTVRSTVISTESSNAYYSKLWQ